MKIKSISTNNFIKHVATLVSGTTIAQLILVAFSPFLTRLYSPQDFGIFSIYLSICVVLATIAAGRYELAILLPKKNQEANSLVLLASALTFLTGLLVFVCVTCFGSKLARYFSFTSLSSVVLFIPLTVISIAFYNIFYYWNNRLKHYKNIAVSKVAQSVILVAFQTLFGVLTFGAAGLIIGYVIGQLSSTGLLLKKYLSHEKYSCADRRQAMMQVGTKYKDFPRFLMVAHFLNALSSQVPIFLLGYLYGAADTGFYALTVRVIGAPMALIGTAVGDVFRQKAAEQYSYLGECKSLYLKTLASLVGLAVLPFIFVYFFAPALFVFIFGEKWLAAGLFAKTMALMYFLQFITTPLSAMFLVAEKQRLDLMWQLLRILLTIGSILLAYHYAKNSQVAVLYLSYAFVFLYGINGVMTFIMSKGHADAVRT